MTAPALEFPPDFLWGAATAAHQVEGRNTNSDWWAWERAPGTPCAEPSDEACDHWNRYPADIALMAGLGLNTYRYSVEWARIEPSEGVFDEAALDHYRAVTDAVLANGLTPMVTLYHFSLPAWLAAKGGWLSVDAPALYVRYARRVVEALAGRVRWFCTINEPGVVSFGGYLGALEFPPGKRDMGSWRRSTEQLVAAHRDALPQLRDAAPGARFGLTNNMQEWEADERAGVFLEFIRSRMEDVYLEAAADDDFVGVQAYSRVQVALSPVAATALRIGLKVPPLVNLVAPPVIRGESLRPDPPIPAGSRRTQMGYEFRPEAIAACVRRTAQLLPGKDLVVTETGVASADDADRVELIDRGLRALHADMTGPLAIPLRGYIHWSFMDNFEWVKGYAPLFGLVGVDRTTQARTVRPSARFLGDIARTGRLPGVS